MTDTASEACAQAHDTASDRAKRAAIAERDAQLDAVKERARDAFYDSAPSPALGLEAKLSGTDAPFARDRPSVDAQYKAIRRELVGGFVGDLERAGLGAVFASRALEREWATELGELNKGAGGQPGLTGSGPARTIAEAIAKWQHRAIAAQRAQGARNHSLWGFIIRASHDPDKIRRASGFGGDPAFARERWIGDALALLDRERTFGGAAPGAVRAIMRDLWARLIAGDHYDNGGPADGTAAPRELYFRSADDWLAYNDRYGTDTATAAVMNAFDRAARTTALLTEFGSNPRAAFERDLRRIQGKLAGDAPGPASIETAEQSSALARREHFLRNGFATFDGCARRPANRTIARITTGVLCARRLSKLGTTPFALVADLAGKAAGLRYQGLTFPERRAGMLASYFQDASGADKGCVADLLHTTIMCAIGDIAARFEGIDTPKGWMARAENWFFKYTGVSPLTSDPRGDADAMMARHLGRQRGKPWTELGAAEQRILERFGIGEREWALLGTADWHTLEDRTYLTPDVASRLAAANLRAYMADASKPYHATAGDGADGMARRVQDELGMKLAACFSDCAEQAISDAGAPERAPDGRLERRSFELCAALGTALRLLMQIKRFPAAMIEQAWVRELRGHSRMDQVAGLAELMVGSTLLGIVANALTAVAEGRDPFPAWRSHPAATFLTGFCGGGAGAIYDDFVLGEFSRAQPGGSTGPSASPGPAGKLWDPYVEATHPAVGRGHEGSEIAPPGPLMARDDLPCGNMWWTRWGADYLIYRELAEWMNPGCFHRLRRQ